MKQTCATLEPSRRRFLGAGMSWVGFWLALTSASLLAGCGNADKSEGQVENPVDPTKTQGGIDSMKGYMDQKKQMQAKGVAPKK
jgi:hypothetical protein